MEKLSAIVPGVIIVLCALVLLLLVFFGVLPRNPFMSIGIISAIAGGVMVMLKIQKSL